MCMCECGPSWCRNEASTGVSRSRWRWRHRTLSVPGRALQWQSCRTRFRSCCSRRRAATARASIAPCRRSNARSSSTARRSTCARRSCTTSTSSSSCASAARSSSTSETEMPEGAVSVFSAHGVAPSVRANAAGAQPADDRRDVPARDEGARRGACASPQEGYTIVLVGHDGHEEVEGTMGEAPEQIVLVQNEEDVDALEVEDPERVAYITQTTLSVDETSAILDAPARALPEDRRSAHRRHLLRDDQPPGGRQADGRRLRPGARDRLAQLLELACASSRSRATAAPRRT